MLLDPPRSSSILLDPPRSSSILLDPRSVRDYQCRWSSGLSPKPPGTPPFALLHVSDRSTRQMEESANRMTGIVEKAIKRLRDLVGGVAHGVERCADLVLTEAESVLEDVRPLRRCQVVNVLERAGAFVRGESGSVQRNRHL